jgi:hypothetical protein
LLKSVDRRAKALGMSRNRLIVRARASSTTGLAGHPSSFRSYETPTQSSRTPLINSWPM